MDKVLEHNFNLHIKKIFLLLSIQEFIIDNFFFKLKIKQIKTLLMFNLSKEKIIC